MKSTFLWVTALPFQELRYNTGPTLKTLHSVETLRWYWGCFVTATDSESRCQPVMRFLGQTSESHDRSNDTAFSFSRAQKLIGPPCGPARSEVICFKLSLRELSDWLSYRKWPQTHSYLWQLPRLQPVTLHLADGGHWVNSLFGLSKPQGSTLSHGKQNMLLCLLVIF